MVKEKRNINYHKSYTPVHLCAVSYFLWADRQREYVQIKYKPDDKWRNHYIGNGVCTMNYHFMINPRNIEGMSQEELKSLEERIIDEHIHDDRKNSHQLLDLLHHN